MLYGPIYTKWPRRASCKDKEQMGHRLGWGGRRHEGGGPPIVKNCFQGRKVL